MDIIHLSLDHSSFEDIMDDCLPHNVPWKTKYRVLSVCISWCNILELHYLSTSSHADNFQCYITHSHKDTLNLKEEYSIDQSTSRMASVLKSLQNSLPPITNSTNLYPINMSQCCQQGFTNTNIPLFSSKYLDQADLAYHVPLNERRIRLLHGK